MEVFRICVHTCVVMIVTVMLSLYTYEVLLTMGLVVEGVCEV